MNSSVAACAAAACADAEYFFHDSITCACVSNVTGYRTEPSYQGYALGEARTPVEGECEARL
jgi:hypothetical protein